MSSAALLRVSGPGRRLVLGAMLAAALALCASAAGAASGGDGKPLKVVATFSILGDLVKEIGGEHVVLATLVGPGGDAHRFEPSPADAEVLAEAQVLVLNGLDFEPWLPRLIQDAGFGGAQVLASRGVSLRHLGAAELRHARHADGRQEGDADPHAWQSLENGVIYVQNIAEGLSKAAPMHRAYYKNRARMLTGQMKKLDAEIRLALAGIPPDRRRIIAAAHDAFGYFAQAYDIHFIPVAGLSGAAEPSAKEMAAIVDAIKKQEVSGVFLESTASPKLISRIASETGAKVGGTLYSDALAASDQPASSYLGMLTWNAGQLIYVLTENLIKD